MNRIEAELIYYIEMITAPQTNEIFQLCSLFSVYQGLAILVPVRLVAHVPQVLLREVGLVVALAVLLVLLLLVRHRCRQQNLVSVVVLRARRVLLENRFIKYNITNPPLFLDTLLIFVVPLFYVKLCDLLIKQ